MGNAVDRQHAEMLAALTPEETRQMQLDVALSEFTERDNWTDSDERWNDAYWHLLSLGYTPEEIGFNDEEVERVRALLAAVRR
jgi:hypothetical protein